MYKSNADASRSWYKNNWIPGQARDDDANICVMQQAYVGEGIMVTKKKNAENLSEALKTNLRRRKAERKISKKEEEKNNDTNSNK